ncbi:hypothetical protein AB0K34_13710 [Actinomadura sp. NPDC049382]|uniref:hypothetical protein n=1 Tax=Actinomadura sp. NPDC049382 TaxID=3158220 RepID=UPI0034322B26
MSTNYYLRMSACDRACDHCAREQEIHLGQNAGGWRFLHRAYREYQPTGVGFSVQDRASWLRLLTLGEVYDEYGARVDRDDLIKLTEDAQIRRPRDQYNEYDFVADGYDFSEGEFS